MNKQRKVSGVRFQVSAQPPAKKTAGLIEKETLPLASFIRWVNEKMNVQHRIMYSVNLKKRLNNTRRKRLRCASEYTLWNLSAPGGFCGSVVLKSIKRSVINIQR